MASIGVINTLTSSIFTLKERWEGDKFFDEIRELEYFPLLVQAVLDRQAAFELSMKKKLDRAHKVDEKLSSSEIEWKMYFQDHEFNSIQDQRNMADALSILTGLSLTRFIKTGRASALGNSFPKGICIVPLKNTNIHSYKIGNPIYSLNRGNTFITTLGRSGNSIMNKEGEYRLGTEEDIKTILSWMFYKNSTLIESVIFDLLGEAQEEEDND